MKSLWLRLGVAVAVAVGSSIAAAVVKAGHSGEAVHRPLPSGPIFGVTVDDISNMTEVVAAAKGMPYMSTTRVYLDPSKPAGYYKRGLSDLFPHSYIMGEILDSSDVPSVTPSSLHSRVDALLSTLGGDVDIWEVGNEVNGGWSGAYSNWARLVVDTYEQVAAAGYRTALTLYENSWGPDNCGDGTRELTPVQYSTRYLPASVRDGLRYVLLSWYPTQCGGLSGNVAVSSITAEVRALHRLYPNALIGFGELGLPDAATPSTEQQARSIMGYYYAVRVAEPYYIGGYFWWYWAEDMNLPGMPAALKDAFRSERSAIG